MRILDPKTGITHENVISLEDYRRAIRPPVESYEQRVERLSQAILKAVGLEFVLTGRDHGDERDVGC